MDVRTVVNKKCPICGEWSQVTFNEEQYARFLRWQGNEANIQDLLPEYTEQEREILISGICAKCWMTFVS